MLAKGEQMKYAQSSLKIHRKGRAAFPSIVPSGDGVRKSARLFRSPVSKTVAYSLIYHFGDRVTVLPFVNGGSGIRKDPAATYVAVRDPHPFTWAISQNIHRRHYACI
jgi:hypothetical protein